jgi:Flp pilus assembly protein TadD
MRREGPGVRGEETSRIAGAASRWLLPVLFLAPYASLLTLALVATSVRADQYRSEVREVAPPPEQVRPKDPKELLKSTTDPYARALLLRDMAGTAAEKKDYKEAARLLEEAIQLKALSGPAAEAMKQDLSALTLATGNFKAQIPQLEAQVKSGTAAAGTYVALGAAYLELKRYRDAVPMLQKGIAGSKDPDPSWKRALVAALIGAGQDAEAAKLLEQLLRSNPAHKEGWLQISALYLKAGSKERAQASMEIANRMGYLADVQDRLRLVTLTGQIGAPFEAASLLQGWIKAGQLPKNPENQKLLAALWMRARESGLALAVLNELVVARPSREIYEQMAQLHLERQDYARASQALSQAMALAGKQGPLLMSLALARYQLADVDGAADAFREAAQFPAQKKLAMDWLKYLESGQARELALAASVDRARRQQEETVALSGRLLGESVDVSAASSSMPSGAAVTAGSRSDGDLTPIGAERSGNAAGTIPSWSGGLTASQWPAGFKKGQRLANPYAGERPLFTITASNLDEHRTRLSEAHQALLRKYPGYRMPVYATHRAAAYPQAIYDATQANHGRAKLLGSDHLDGARLGFPFPQPQSGVEVMWNHRVRYRGNTVESQSQQAVVGANGKETLRVRVNERAYFRYGNTLDPADIAQQNILLYYLLRFTAPGNNLLALAHETANSDKDARAIWVGPPGLGRLFRVPPVGYDQPFPSTEGLYYVDMIDMYNGAFDRYVWKLVGKRELYLPYNGYRLSDGSFRYEQLLTPNHLNPDATRYELHRVWVVEATERGGKHHSFGLRTFYVDEDSWNVALVENHDREGGLWRFQEGHLLPLYDVPAVNSAPVITYDLRDGRYFASRLTAEEPPAKYDVPMKTSEFMPATVEARHVR